MYLAVSGFDSETNAERDWAPGKYIPFLSSIVTVSLAHFMRNLSWWSARVCEGRALKFGAQLGDPSLRERRV